MPTFYLVRHGAMRHVGRFVAEDHSAYRKGDVVVVRSRRGDELGEVVSAAMSAEASPTSARVLRIAEGDDRRRARVAEADRPRRLAAIERFFGDGEWPLQPIDAEPMLDEGRTVLLYLGPHKLDSSALLQSLRDACGLDVILEPVGVDADDEEVDAHDHGGCGSCGLGGGCGEGGGCGTDAGGCSGCAVKDLVRGSRTAAVVG